MLTIILFGGNSTQTVDLFRQAEEIISTSFGDIIEKSSIYKSPPYGFEADTDFFNKVIEVKTKLTPNEQIFKLLDIEKILGRKRNINCGYESRCIDLDILFIDDLIIETSYLTVPHPRLHLRRFTLVPLNEKWSYKFHPKLKKTMKELLLECSDESEVVVSSE
ncbi:MAG: 2-amino-4-hydroxy-6-hydroxymethyldihydropteridine diphosphokinase [Marinilabiliaceae bacterium]|nr:2-amino-4-hydroxy-6-hydroxymethyldihydropteridine diphosphokinase [Marinilabiliaceae bacterium]